MILIKLSAFIGSNCNNSYTCFVSHAYSKCPGIVYLVQVLVEPVSINKITSLLCLCVSDFCKDDL